MTNHPNRNWRSKWSVDLEKATATHSSGWVFEFSPAADEKEAFDGKCIRQPEELTTEDLKNAARIAREAGDAYIEARRKRN